MSGSSSVHLASATFRVSRRRFWFSKCPCLSAPPRAPKAPQVVGEAQGLLGKGLCWAGCPQVPAFPLLLQEDYLWELLVQRETSCSHGRRNAGSDHSVVAVTVRDDLGQAAVSWTHCCCWGLGSGRGWGEPRTSWSSRISADWRTERFLLQLGSNTEQTPTSSRRHLANLPFSEGGELIGG